MKYTEDSCNSNPQKKIIYQDIMKLKTSH